MDQNERRMIEDLFARLRQAEQQAGPRDREAEQEIAQALGRQPAAPYYMSQVILMQEQAVRALGDRVQKLEQELAERPAGGGSFLGGLFGGGSGQSAATVQTAETVYGTPAAPANRGWSNQPPAATERVPAMPPGTSYGAQPAFGNRGGFGPAQAGGSGFLGSALKTAAGVAGGMLLANAVGGLFGGAAHAGEVPGAAAQAQAAAAQAEAAAAQAQAAADRADEDTWRAPPDDLSDRGDLLADNDGADFDTFGDF